MSHLIETYVPDKFYKWTLEQMVGAENVEEVKQKVQQYLNNPNLESDGLNLYIYSFENGTGKTLLGYYILQALHMPRLKFDKVRGESLVQLTPIVAVKFKNYLNFCLEMFDPTSKYDKTMVETAPILLLDDVSTWATSDNPHRDRKELISLMMYRSEHLLPTIITSNLAPESFNKTFGTTANSKALENFSFIEVRGGDVRPVLFPDQFEEEDNDK